MQEPIIIRRPSVGDGPVIRELRIAALTDAPYAFGSSLSEILNLPASSFEDDAVRHSSSDTSTSFLLFKENSAIGMVGAFVESSSGRPFICSLWLSPLHRGSSLASKLVLTAIQWLQARGAQDIFAWVADKNVRAIGFYRKLGFIKAGDCQALPSNPSEIESLYRYTSSNS